MNDDVQQQLWELVYGLLSDEESRALCELITSDPAVARAYAKVKLQTELVESAARYDATAVSWYEVHPAAKADAPTVAVSAPSRTPLRRTANWMVGLAAAGLVAVFGSAWGTREGPPVRENLPVAMAAPVRTMVVGPSELHSEVGNSFTIQTSSLAGKPVATNVRYRVLDQAGQVALEESESTDSRGTVRIELPRTLNRLAARLEVVADDALGIPVSRPLQVSDSQAVTYLRLDRPLYQPGETVLFRSVTLSRFGQQAVDDIGVQFQILDANDQELPGSRQFMTTQQGVASGRFQLPQDLAEGEYALIATSTEGLFPEEVRRLTVRQFMTPRLKAKLELTRDSYAPGDEVEADLLVEKAEGGAVAQAPLQIELQVDQETYAIPQGNTNEDGFFRLRLKLPETVVEGQANLAVTITEPGGHEETVSEQIPINLGRVNVDFFPEGGELVEGLPNRVYFHGRDPLGQPVHLRGRILDDRDGEVAEVATQHEGRGIFGFTPAFSRSYRLVLDTPALGRDIPLPPISAERFVALNGHEGVFAPLAPLKWTISTREPSPLIVAAYCRGAMVGQTAVQPTDFQQQAGGYWSSQGELPLSNDAQGVIRLTVFSAAEQPPQPVAERLVFRRIEKKLSVDLAPDRERYDAGEEVTLNLHVQQEDSSPAQATLGISLTDDAVLSLAKDKSVRMPTYFHLLTEIENPQDLEDANFYLSDQPGAAAALDLLLATQGWRRFVEVPWSSLVQNRAGIGGGFGGFGRYSSNMLGRGLEAAGASPPLVVLGDEIVPQVNDNSTEIELSQARLVEPAENAPAVPTPTRLLPWWIPSALFVLLFVGITLMDLRPRWKAVALGASIALAVGWGWLVYGQVRPATSASSLAASKEVLAGSERSLQERKLADGTIDFKTMAAPANAWPESEALLQAPATELDLQALPRDAVPRVQAPEVQLAAEPGLGGASTPVTRERRVNPEQARGGLTDLAPPVSPAPPAPAGPPESPPAPARAEPESLARDPSPKAADAFGATLEASSPRALREPMDRGEDLRQRMAVARELAPPTANVRELKNSPAQATLLWEPRLVTDANGDAVVRFTLPNTQTSYRLIVEAHGAGRLGSGERLVGIAPRE